MTPERERLIRATWDRCRDDALRLFRDYPVFRAPYIRTPTPAFGPEMTIPATVEVEYLEFTHHRPGRGNRVVMCEGIDVWTEQGESRGSLYTELCRVTREVYVQVERTMYYILPVPDYIATHQKSTELLRSWLSPTQLAEFDKTGEFTVVGNHSGKKYLITSGSQPYNVVELAPKGRLNNPHHRYCFVPTNNARSAGDVMLAQKIALETDEKAALAVANRPLN